MVSMSRLSAHLTLHVERLHIKSVEAQIPPLGALWKLGEEAIKSDVNKHFLPHSYTTKKVFNAQPIGTRRKGRLNLRWSDGLEKDLPVLRTRDWRIPAGIRLSWKKAS
ncbi:hypothetical protein TNCV_4486081 [Trichonephila clavipes]|nr:hypothetical protein TNCV_4486081 [Trichonephila clavipes]